VPSKLYAKFGPKKTILIGGVLLTGAHILAAFVLGSDLGKFVATVLLFVLGIAGGQGACIIFLSALGAMLKQHSIICTSLVSLVKSYKLLDQWYPLYLLLGERYFPLSFETRNLHKLLSSTVPLHHSSPRSSCLLRLRYHLPEERCQQERRKVFSKGTCSEKNCVALRYCPWCLFDPCLLVDDFILT